MGASSGTPGTSRLARLAQRATEEREAALEHCEMCSEAIADEHRHLLDLEHRQILCSCRACALLFDRPAAAEGRLRLIPERGYRIEDLELSDLAWEELRLPVDIAFVVRRSADDGVGAFYPSPMGATESLLTLEAWQQLEDANPVLRTLTPDVEALLVNRARGARQAWIVPIDVCYRLVGLIRTRWRGLTGGKEVWEELRRSFEELDRRSRPASRQDRRPTTAASSAAGRT
jgi:hypothetical protein